MHTYTAEGIILKRTNFGEADRIITCFTKDHGRVKGVAKGVRRITSRRSPHLEVFNHVIVTLHRGREIDSVMDVYTKKNFIGVRGDWQKTALAFNLIELVERLCPERQEHNYIYNLLLGTLTKLDIEIELDKTMAQTFTSELLWDLGFLPRNSHMEGDGLDRFVETIIERKLKSLTLTVR